MWSDLPISQRNKYKNLIRAFASLTEMFAQKASKDDIYISPIIFSKYQETAFQHAFDAFVEDIGNTAFDASVEYNGEKYLVGIKTFGISSGDQKIAQFKAMNSEWSHILNEINKNATLAHSKKEVDLLNSALYRELAKRIALIRNERIDSSFSNIRGFNVDDNDAHIHFIYHVLMPSKKGEIPRIYVGETSYDRIDIDQLTILGCTDKNKPSNFSFTDGKHKYKFTSADSQLYMDFENQSIVCDKWSILYVDNPDEIFTEIADQVYHEPNYVQKASKLADKQGKYPQLKSRYKPDIVRRESYSWTIWNKNGETELFSGFNSFYGTGSKLSKEDREKRINSIYNSFKPYIDNNVLDDIIDGLTDFLLGKVSSSDDRLEKVRLRKRILELCHSVNNTAFEKEISKVLFRPVDEMYIPIPDSSQFHKNHPNFFGKGYGECIPGTSKLVLPKEKRQFRLVFDPSGASITAYITQDNGKAIESVEKQSVLGEWILRGIFQLEQYEPLSSAKLVALGINGLRFTRYENSTDIHVEFIWIDEKHPPKDYIFKP